jgi:hypothetical protein
MGMVSVSVIDCTCGGSSHPVAGEDTTLCIQRFLVPQHMMMIGILCRGTSTYGCLVTDTLVHMPLLLLLPQALGACAPWCC